MKQKKKTISRVVLFTIMMVYLEVVFQLLIYGSATWGMLFGALFALPTAFLFTLLTGLGPERLNRVLTTLLMIVIEVLFNAQLVYYEIFHTYMQVFSIINGAGNAVEFSSVIWDCLVEDTDPSESAHRVFLLVLPKRQVRFCKERLEDESDQCCRGCRQLFRHPACVKHGR